jgi:hypothetical protein
MRLLLPITYMLSRPVSRCHPNGLGSRSVQADHGGIVVDKAGLDATKALPGRSPEPQLAVSAVAQEEVRWVVTEPRGPGSNRRGGIYELRHGHHVSALCCGGHPVGGQ